MIISLTNGTWILGFIVTPCTPFCVRSLVSPSVKPAALSFCSLHSLQSILVSPLVSDSVPGSPGACLPRLLHSPSSTVLSFPGLTLLWLPITVYTSSIKRLPSGALAELCSASWHLRPLVRHWYTLTFISSEDIAGSWGLFIREVYLISEPRRRSRRVAARELKQPCGRGLPWKRTRSGSSWMSSSPLALTAPPRSSGWRSWETGIRRRSLGLCIHTSVRL